MYKLVLFMLCAVFLMSVHALQVDQELAMHTLFQAKHGLNAAVHAAAQQTDAAKLSRGIVSIDPDRAEATARHYLARYLRLDDTLAPQAGTFLQTKLDVLDLMIVNEQAAFPYTYRNETYDYSVTLDHPGVVMIVSLEYPRTFRVLGPIVWQVKAAAELTY